ncbi:uroporphyrinogen-III C-methyltransferase [Paraglaciecola agarilytica]|uniref:uroporphyrinogen-III C-methyltransferase n=1 Tax=Paraglaciecola chathamensis TaxID=368405 RepID=UPI001C08719F|nr:uroporphyrinogen-III C-methyltransferase [Paraglaciecola agarilytica]MBU3019046.1 uroporphyrinogen-III C-methyltransferase [Paraglaciecola agarilytica]
MADQSDTNKASDNKPKEQAQEKTKSVEPQKASAQEKPQATDKAVESKPSTVITPAPPKAETNTANPKKSSTAPLKSDNNVKKTTSTSDNSDNRATSKANSGANQKPAKTGFLWFVTIINLLILLLIIAAAYWGWTQWEGQKQSQQARQSEQQDILNRQAQQNLSITDEVKEQNSRLESQLRSVSEELQSVNQALQGARDDAQAANEQSLANKQTLSSIAGRRPADWLLAEADFLVRMAGRKLWLEHDLKTAVTMLQSADSRLQDLDDPSLLPVRERLANDIQTLAQVNPVSVSSIAVQLSALVSKVDQLPLNTFERPDIATEGGENVSESVDDWQANLSRAWAAFTKDFFSYKKKETDVQPYMSAQQQWLATEQLKLSLLQAQSAVLKENAALYQQSLQNALSALSENFATDDGSVQQFEQRINELNETDIERVYPSQFSSAPALQDVIQQRMDNVFVNGASQP